MHRILIAVNRLVLFSVLAFTSVVCLAQKPELVVQEGHSKYVSSMAFSPDGKLLVSGSEDHTVKLWEVATGRMLRTFVGHSDQVTSVAFSPNGKNVASGSWDKTIKLWDIAAGKELHTFAEGGYVNSVAFSRDGTILVGGDITGIVFWNINTTQRLRTIAVWDINAEIAQTMSGGGKVSSNSVRCVAFSPDGNAVAAGMAEKTIKLWHADGTSIRELVAYEGAVHAIAFAPNGETLVSAGDQTIKIWEVSTGRQSLTINFKARSVAFSPDGTLLASGGSD